MIVLNEENYCLWWLVEYDFTITLGGIGCSVDNLLEV